MIDQKDQPQERVVPRTGVVASFIGQHRELASALAFFVLMMLAFTIASPSVWLNSLSYTAVFVSLPIYVILTISLVFVIVAGEIDLSFPSIVGVAALVFSEFVLAGWNPYLCLLLALLAGGVAGLINGMLVASFGFSSLIVTLGMNFFWRGFIQIITNGSGASLAFLEHTSFDAVFVGQVGGIPVQMLWAAGFAILGLVLFSYHKFGVHVRFVGDNTQAARRMGINVRLVKVMSFVYVGVASGFVGVLATLINNNFYPTTGDSYLLTVLAAVFVGGTPGTGGTGTVAGGIVGAFTVGFIESGIVAAGLTGYWTQFIYGIVIVLSLLTHKLYNSQHKK